MPYTSPFEVICVSTGNSKQLFHDQKYTCTDIYLDTYSSTATIKLKDISPNFSIDRFLLPDGSKILMEEFRTNSYSSKIAMINLLDDDRFKEGQCIIGSKIICDVNNLKTIIKDKLYYISDVSLCDVHRGSVNYQRIDKIKIEGSNKWYSAWNFCMLDISISRELDIDSILGNENSKLKEMTTYTKDVDESEKINNLLSSITDAINYKKKLKNTNLTISDIIKKRSLSKYNIKMSDFSYLNNIEWEKFIN